MSKLKTVPEFQQTIEKMLTQQVKYQKNGNYVAAEKHRLLVEKTKRDLQTRILYQMEQKYVKRLTDAEKTYHQQMNTLVQSWNHKINKFTKEAQQNDKEMKERHKKQQKELRQQLQLQLPSKVKESNQLLNLRIMQQHMKKQKNYVQAHHTQLKITKLQKEQAQAWIKSKQATITNAIAQLAIKQSGQALNVNNKNKQQLEKLSKDKYMAETACTHKYQTNIKDLKSQYQRQFLSFKGQFRTVGGHQLSTSKLG